MWKILFSSHRIRLEKENFLLKDKNKNFVKNKIREKMIENEVESNLNDYWPNRTIEIFSN